MKELPYFKFYPNQWITGSISFMDLDVQGAFMKVCFTTGAKNVMLQENK